MASVSIRKAIRYKIQELLIDADTLAMEKVFRNRIRAVDEDKLPCISIRTLRETSDRLNEAAVTFERTLTLGIVCAATADENLDDVLDQMAGEVESVILGADVNNLFKDANGNVFINRIDLADTDLTLDLGDAPIGASMVTFRIEYDSKFDPTVDPLEGFNIELKAAGAADPIFTDEIDEEQ